MDQSDKPKYELGAKVLVHVQPHPGHKTEAFLPGSIEECLGKMDIYDGRVPQEEVDFPIMQHFYLVALEEGGHVSQFESRILSNPTYSLPNS